VRSTWLLLAIVLGSCGTLPLSRPRTINLPRPSTPFLETFWRLCGRGADFETLSCRRESPARALGCDEVRRQDQLAALTPAYPIALCKTWPGLTQPPPPRYIAPPNAFLAPSLRYIVERQGKPILISSVEDLAKVFRPIGTPEEALSFALAATRHLPSTGQPPPSGSNLYREPNPTSVQRVLGGFVVANLRTAFEAGCGPHKTFAVNLLVTHQGELREVSRHLLYDDNNPGCYD
jgi:hypothetical protein